MSIPFLFDVHTHAQFAAYDDDRDAVIQRARDAGVWMVNVGTQKETSKKAVALAHQYLEGVWAAVGLHPIHTEQSYHDEQESGTKNQESGEKVDYGYYKNLALDPKVVAIGECGLDYYRIKNQESRMKQFDALKQQIELAIEVQKPLMIHCRDAHEDLLAILKSFRSKLSPDRAGIMHFFGGVGSWENVSEYLDMGFYISLAGVVTFENYAHAGNVRHVPLDRILLETDAPYVAPVPYRGKRNEPQYITETAKKLAALKDLSFEEIAGRTTLNAKTMFGI